MDGRATMVPGAMVLSIFARGRAQPATVYTRYGDWVLAIPCGIATAVLLCAIGVGRRRGKTLATSNTMRHDRPGLTQQE
jgi:hypothetical protein